MKNSITKYIAISFSVLLLGCNNLPIGWDDFPVGTNTPPVVTNMPPVVTNMPPVTDIVVPPRMGVNEYVGNGAFRSFRVVPGAKNPTKGITMQCWFKINAWVRTDVGVSLINRGMCGSHWAYNLTVRPDCILYNATKGAVISKCSIKTGTWYHVRMDVDGDVVRTWLDGKIVPVTTYETKILLGTSTEPLRIGGYMVPENWGNATWYNTSLNGVMSDYEIVYKSNTLLGTIKSFFGFGKSN